VAKEETQLEDMNSNKQLIKICIHRQQRNILLLVVKDLEERVVEILSPHMGQTGLTN